MSTSVVNGETYPRFVVDLSHENQSYPKVVPRLILAAKNGPLGPLLAAKNGPILPKLVLAGPNMAIKIDPGDHFWQPKVVPRTSLSCYEWSCFPILTAEKVE